MITQFKNMLFLVEVGIGMCSNVMFSEEIEQENFKGTCLEIVAGQELQELVSQSNDQLYSHTLPLRLVKSKKKPRDEGLVNSKSDKMQFEVTEEECDSHEFTLQGYVETGTLFPLNFTLTAPVTMVDITVGFKGEHWFGGLSSGARVMYYPEEVLDEYLTVVTRVPFLAQARWESETAFMKMGVGICVDTYDPTPEFMSNMGVGLKRGHVGIFLSYEFARAPHRDLRPSFYSFVGVGLTLLVD